MGLYSEQGSLVQEVAAGVNGAPDTLDGQAVLTHLTVSAADHPDVVGQRLQLRLMKNKAGQGHYHYIHVSHTLTNWDFEGMTAGGIPHTLAAGTYIHFMDTGNTGLANTAIVGWQQMGAGQNAAGLYPPSNNEVAEGSNVLF